MKEKPHYGYWKTYFQLILCAYFMFFSNKGSAQDTPKVKSTNINQSILASAGGIQKFSEIELEWTLGESFIGEATNSSRIYTIGFHQPFIIEAVDLKEKLFDSQISVFPNPVGNKLNVKFNLENAENAGKFQFILSDMFGKQILNQLIDQNSGTSVDIPEMATGQYFVKIMNQNKIVRTFKIIKSN